MDLRPYQQAAVDAVYNHLRSKDNNPCIVLPTGCHAKDHPILMYDGTMRKVQDVKVGELIIGADKNTLRFRNSPHAQVRRKITFLLIIKHLQKEP